MAVGRQNKNYRVVVLALLLIEKGDVVLAVFPLVGEILAVIVELP